VGYAMSNQSFSDPQQAIPDPTYRLAG